MTAPYVANIIKPITTGTIAKPLDKPLDKIDKPSGTKKSPSRIAKMNCYLLVLTSSLFISLAPLFQFIPMPALI